MKQFEGEKETKILDLIRNTIREAEPTAQIILYGSRARGDAREDSDWDVLNVFSHTKQQWEQSPPSMYKYNVVREGIQL